MRNPKQASRGRRSPRSNWHQIYFAAVLETDQKRALLKIRRAQKVIEIRLRELMRVEATESIEIRDLNSALTYLALLLQYVDYGQKSGS